MQVIFHIFFKMFGISELVVANIHTTCHTKKEPISAPILESRPMLSPIAVLCCEGYRQVFLVTLVVQFLVEGCDSFLCPFFGIEEFFI